MTDPDSRIARLEENMHDIDEWRKACAALPINVAELVEWRRLQNGFLKDLRDDVRCLKAQYSEIKGATKLMKIGVGLAAGSVAAMFIQQFLR
jgi:hypothetical protein